MSRKAKRRYVFTVNILTEDVDASQATVDAAAQRFSDALEKFLHLELGDPGNGSPYTSAHHTEAFGPVNKLLTYSVRLEKAYPIK